MKQVFNAIVAECGAQDFKWYHWIIVANWCFSFMMMTGVPEHLWMYLFMLPYFGVSSWLLTKCPIRDDE